ncbi:MAG TPA: L,D-transpeptidase [Spirochaetota bacterium]|nr:L,D-transpeptidase [Spirochaetota bacterium]
MAVRSFPLVIVSALAFFFCACGGGADEVEKAFRGFKGKYAILVSKKDFTLEVYDRRMRRVASYRIAYGLNPDKKAKVHAGDNRTPEGAYHVTEILSMDADRSSGAYRKLRDMNSVYFRASDGHSRYGFPKADLGCDAYGPRFFLLSYPSRSDIEQYGRAVKEGSVVRSKGGALPGPGSGIAIHGNNDEASIGHLSSSGCIRMFNSDIVELERYVIIGTPVVIQGR